MFLCRDGSSIPDALLPPGSAIHPSSFSHGFERSSVLSQVRPGAPMPSRVFERSPGDAPEMSEAVRAISLSTLDEEEEKDEGEEGEGRVETRRREDADSPSRSFSSVLFDSLKIPRVVPQDAHRSPTPYLVIIDVDCIKMDDARCSSEKEGVLQVDPSLLDLCRHTFPNSELHVVSESGQIEGSNLDRGIRTWPFFTMKHILNLVRADPGAISIAVISPKTRIPPGMANVVFELRRDHSKEPALCRL